jgi:hypothetical protein
LVLNTESPKKNLWNGSEENLTVPSTIDIFKSMFIRFQLILH